MPKLTTLNATFIRATGDDSFRHVEDLATAQGIRFACPQCYGRNGEHQIILWFAERQTPSPLNPAPRWSIEKGTGLNDLSLVPSIQVEGGCAWHGWIKNGSAA